MENIIHYSETIYNSLRKINLCKIFTQTTIRHIIAILITAFSTGYRGKTVDFARNSSCHRTTIAHFLNKGKWNDQLLEDTLKSLVIQKIYSESERTGKPIYCVVDDTILSKTKPSSRALHPIENAYFHYSHLKGKQDYGHQAVAVMLSCNGIVLNYATIMYDKSKSKIQLIQDIAAELPIPPVVSYFLCDSWYACPKVMDSFVKRGFYTVGALKTNRIIYPCNIKQQIGEFALYLRETDTNVRLVTVGHREYYVYRYEGKLNGLDDAVVLITYPKDAFLNPVALRAFICTEISLTTEEILSIYTERWAIEVFFRSCKNKLAFDDYQIRSANGIKRFWLLMSLAHYFACTSLNSSFDDGYIFIQNQIRIERISFIYLYGVNRLPLDDLLAVSV